MKLIFDLIQRWGFRFFKDYVETEQRVTVLEKQVEMQMEINKGILAEIERLKKK